MDCGEDMALMTTMHKRDPMREPIGKKRVLVAVHVPCRIRYKCHREMVKRHLLPGVNRVLAVALW